MMTIAHITLNGQVAEVKSDDLVINSADDGLQLLGDLYYQGFGAIILFAKNITPEFFDLSTGMAGEILQKFSNYRMRLAIVGDFENLESKSLADFICESNRGQLVYFAPTVSDALERFS